MSVMEHVIAISDTADIVNKKAETAWSDTVVFVTDSPKLCEKKNAQKMRSSYNE